MFLTDFCFKLKVVIDTTVSVLTKKMEDVLTDFITIADWNFC